MPRAADQLPLHLPAPPAEGETPLVPVRMLNEWTYCPRLAYLEWVEGEWAESADTAQGSRAHRRSDKGGGKLPPAPDPDPGEADDADALPDFGTARAITLSSERLGIIAKMDMVEADDGAVVPVDIKKGKRPHTSAGAWEPERVQVCAQALILEDNGYTVSEGALWFAGSRERVRIELDADLRRTTQEAIAGLRLTAAAGKRPPPLDNSPKCVRCSLAGICLPDETRFFATRAPPRPLNPSADPALPLYVQTPGARIGKSGERLKITAADETTEVPLIDVSEVALFGPVSLSTPALHALLRADIPVAWHSTGGWLMGHTHSTGTKNIDVRIAQFRAAFDERRSLRLARGLVASKIKNQRTMLRRNWRDEADQSDKPAALKRLRRLAMKSETADSPDLLLGFEGEAAAIYFRHLPEMITSDAGLAFDFARRTRRPPTDPVNALLSFAYAVLTRTMIASAQSVGFDPYLGFYHRPRHGRPALALDLIEPYRPLIADSVVLTAINNGEVREGDFIFSGGACAMKPRARKALLAAYERRLDQELTHPLFGYRLSTRRLLEVQARLLARHLGGEIADYPHYCPR